MKIKFLLIASFFILSSCQFAPAQTVEAPKTVVVSKDFVDDAAKAFDLIVAQRDAIAKCAATGTMTDIERQNAAQLIKGLDELIGIKDKTISAVEKLGQIYEKIIVLYDRMLDRMDKMLTIEQNSKKKSTLWQQIKNVFQVLAILIGIRKAADFINK